MSFQGMLLTGKNKKKNWKIRLKGKIHSKSICDHCNPNFVSRNEGISFAIAVLFKHYRLLQQDCWSRVAFPSIGCSLFLLGAAATVSLLLAHPLGRLEPSNFCVGVTLEALGFCFSARGRGRREWRGGSG